MCGLFKIFSKACFFAIHEQFEQSRGNGQEKECMSGSKQEEGNLLHNYNSWLQKAKDEKNVLRYICQI